MKKVLWFGGAVILVAIAVGKTPTENSHQPSVAQSFDQAVTKMTAHDAEASSKRLHQQRWIDHALLDEHLPEHPPGGFLLGQRAVQLLLREHALFNQDFADSDAFDGCVAQRKLRTPVFTSS